MRQVGCSGTLIAMLAITIFATMASNTTDVQTTELVKQALVESTFCHNGHNASGRSGCTACRRYGRYVSGRYQGEDCRTSRCGAGRMSSEGD